MSNDAPLTAHERLAAAALLERINDAIKRIFSRDANLPWWVIDAAHTGLCSAAYELQKALEKDNAWDVRRCLAFPPSLPSAGCSWPEVPANV